MSDRLITAEEAQKRLSELEAMSDWTGEDRIAAEYASTVIAQAEQVERLQRAFETALSEVNDLNEETYNHMAGPFRPQGPADYDLTAEDMEATDE